MPQYILNTTDEITCCSECPIATYHDGGTGSFEDDYFTCDVKRRIMVCFESTGRPVGCPIGEAP